MAIHTATWSGVTTGTALKTMCQIATPSTTRAEIIEWSLSFNGTSASAVPATVQVNRQTTAGTGGVTGTAFPQDLADPTALVTVLTGPLAAVWTAEPTAGNLVYQDYYTPVGLGPFLQYPLGRGIVLPVSARIAIVVTTAVAVSAAGHIVWNE